MGAQKRRVLRRSPRDRFTLAECQQKWEGLLKSMSINPEAVDHLEAAVDGLLRRDSDLLRRDEELYLKACAQLAELLIHCGRSKPAAEVLHRGEEVMAKLPQLVAADAPGKVRQLTRERLRYAANFIDVTYFQTQQYAEAARLLDKLKDLVVGPNGLATPAFPCHGTLRALFFQLARVHASVGRLEVAATCYSSALAANTAKVKEQLDRSRKTPAAREANLNAVRHHAAMVLLGLAELEYTRGALAKVLWFVHPARALVAHSRDEITKAYADMLYSMAVRSRTGDIGTKDAETCKSTELDEAIATLQKSLHVFEAYRHTSNGVRARFELAMAYASAGQSSEAERLFTQLIDPPLIASHALTRRSRLALKRENREMAVALASQAVEVARNRQSDKRNLVVAEIEAKIARAEAHLLRPTDGAGARADLESALKLLQELEGGDDRTLAICLLLTAQSYARELMVRDAQRYLEEAGRVLPRVENMNVRRLEQTVQQSIEELLNQSDFHIRVGPEQPLDYRMHARALQKFLLTRAKLGTSNRREIARKLKISPTTLATWERDLRGTD